MIEISMNSPFFFHSTTKLLGAIVKYTIAIFRIRIYANNSFRTKPIEIVHNLLAAQY